MAEKRYTVGDFMRLPLAIRKMLGARWKAMRLRGRKYDEQVAADMRVELERIEKGQGKLFA